MNPRLRKTGSATSAGSKARIQAGSAGAPAHLRLVGLGSASAPKATLAAPTTTSAAKRVQARSGSALR